MWKLIKQQKNVTLYQNCCIKRHQKRIGRKPSLTFKTEWTHSRGSCDNSQSFEQLTKHVTAKNFENKLGFEPESPSMTGKLCYLYNSLVTGVW